MDALQIAQQLLLEVKRSKSGGAQVIRLANLSGKTLKKQLSTDERKKAFWINVYNASSFRLLQNAPKAIEFFLKRFQYFNKKEIVVAHHFLSLNDIEHGLLRRSKIWWSKGYLNKLWISGFERELRVERLDPRIHFALNCGAASCPPVRAYDHKKIDEQLDTAAVSFLESETNVDEEHNEATTSAILNWYRGDFGGKKGILNLLRKYNVLRNNQQPKIKFSPYSWAPDLHNFS